MTGAFKKSVPGSFGKKLINELPESAEAELLIKRTQAKLNKNRLNKKAYLEICELKAQRGN